MKKLFRIFSPVDIITLGYIIITGLFMIASASRLEGISGHFITRLWLVLIITGLAFLDFRFPNKIIRFLRHFYPLTFLGFFYPETDYLNNIFFQNLDPFVSKIEHAMFGCQPSIVFSQAYPWKWFSEIMNLGYFSYFFIMFGVALTVYLTNYTHFSKTIFVICGSFYLYYAIFILFPVVGPQFYFSPPDNLLPDAGFFREAVKWVDSVGERPTGAFPSSHVGVAGLLIWLAIRYAPKALYWLAPLSVLLFFSTVYIKAHYLVDVIGGFASVPVMYWVTSWAHGAMEKAASRRDLC